MPKSCPLNEPNRISCTPIGDEILRKKADCIRQNFILEKVFINPADLISLLTDLRFVDMTYYATTSNPLDRNEIGQIVGVKIIVSNTIPPHKLLYSVSIGGYRSLQGSTTEWDSNKKPDEKINPSRRDNDV